MDNLKTQAVRLLAVLLTVLSIGVAFSAAIAAAAPKPTAPTITEPTEAELEQWAIDIATGEPVLMSEGAKAAMAAKPKNLKPAATDTGGVQTMAVTGWINISRSQGSLNCVIEARQNGSHWWQTRVLPGGCRAVYIEAYAYNTQYMADLDWQVGGLSGGRIFESRSPVKLCYIYVYWRDGANVFRDVVFWDGGSQF